MGLAIKEAIGMEYSLEAFNLFGTWQKSKAVDFLTLLSVLYLAI
jgi:hypothetical protein